jgi:hypothetical protein
LNHNRIEIPCGFGIIGCKRHKLRDIIDNVFVGVDQIEYKSIDVWSFFGMGPSKPKKMSFIARVLAQSSGLNMSLHRNFRHILLTCFIQF